MKKSSEKNTIYRIGLAVLAFMLVTGLFMQISRAEEKTIIPAEEMTAVPTVEGISNKEAAVGYIQRQMDSLRGLKDWGQKKGITGFSALEEREQKIYNALVPQITAVAEGERSSTVFTVPYAAVFGEIPTVTVSTFDEGIEILRAQIYIKLDILLDALLSDYPYELFWYDKTQSTSYKPEGGYSYNGEVCTLNGDHYTFSFPVVQEYAVSGEKYTFNTQLYGNVETAVNNANTIITNNQGRMDREKLIAYKEAICDATAYNTSAASGNTAYGNPWQMIWVFDGDPETKVVCEGYSKAFQYLCDNGSLSSSRSILVSGVMWGGTGQGRHMWNIVRQGDGKNYLVDVTNSDSGSVGQNGGLFLARSTDEGNRTYEDEQGVEQYDTLIYPVGSSTIEYGYDDKTIALYGADALDTLDKPSITGECGDNLTWELSDGVLTISGTGAMDDFQIEGSPWYSYIDEITTVNIESGATNVGICAFYNCINLTSVSLPDTLTRLNNNCFYGCSNLTSIEIPEGVTEIANSVFARCSKLETVLLPESLETIGSYAFSYCNMTSIVIPDAAKIGAWNGCFMYCPRLVSVTLPAELSDIPASAFQGCDALTAIEIPSSVRSIGDDAFSGCSSLATVEIPANVTDIGIAAFDSCYALSEINIPSGVTILYEYTFVDCGLKSIVIPSTMTSIGQEAFGYCTDLTDVYYTGLKDDWDQISIGTGNDPLTIAKLHTHYGTPHSWGEVSYSWAEDYSTATATRICSVDSTYCIETENATLTSTVTKEATCTAKGETTYTATFTNEAFETQTEIVANIPATGHDEEPTYTEAIAATCTTAGNPEYWTCSKCKKTFSDEDCQNEITDVVIPALGHDVEEHPAKAATCTEAGWNAYETCKREGCDHSTKVEIPALGHDVEEHPAKAASCTEAGWNAYETCKRDGCAYSTYDEIPIDPNAHDLEHHEAQAATCVQAGWKEYDTCKREGCEYSTYDEIPIDLNAHDVEYHDAKLPTCTAVGWEAYETCKREDCHYSTYVEIPKLAHSIDEHHEAVAATEQADGNIEYWVCSVCHHMFSDEAGANEVTSVTIPKLSPSLPPAGNHSDASANYTVNADGTATCKGPKKDTATVTIPDTIKVGNFNVPVTKIADKAFKGKKKLKTVTIGTNIKEIGTSAFEGCKKLKTVKGGANVEKIGAKAYKDCVALTKYTIGAKVNYIGKNAFNGCTKLKTITVKSTLLTSSNVKSGAFKKISAKATFKVPKAKKKEYAKFLPKKGTKTVKVK